MTAQQISILFKLEERWELYRRVRGDKWPSIVADYEKYIRARMAADGSELLPAALSLGKMLSDANENPNELFAAAVEILKREAPRSHLPTAAALRPAAV